jgi:uncharacterized membrane protein SpoIIM required for sporulation
VLGSVVAILYFSETRELGAAALIALGLGPTLAVLLERNREEIWVEGTHPVTANRRFALAMLVLFLSVLAVAAVVARIFPPEIAEAALTQRYRNDFSALLLHNGSVLAAGAFFAALYRANGLMLLVAYNAMYWGAAFSEYCAYSVAHAGVLPALILLVSLLPHAVMEVLAYILAGMAGTFLSLATKKYALDSSEYRRVARACGYLLLLSLAVLVVSVGLEKFLAEPVFHSVVG